METDNIIKIFCDDYLPNLRVSFLKYGTFTISTDDTKSLLTKAGFDDAPINIEELTGALSKMAIYILSADVYTIPDKPEGERIWGNIDRIINKNKD